MKRQDSHRPESGPRRVFFVPANLPSSVIGGAASTTTGTMQSLCPNEKSPENVPSFSSLQLRHLDWSHKQGRILTADGKAATYYANNNANNSESSFSENELPHYHLQIGNTHPTFIKWSEQEEQNFLISGAWARPLFVGGWEHSTDEDECCYNVQTPTLFVDLRIPTTRNRVLPANCTSLLSLDNVSLRMYARQHVFAGYTSLNWEQQQQGSSATHCSETSKPPDGRRKRPVCTRHHCIDWNFVGVPRSVPNKWWVEMSSDEQTWKEWAYPKDENGQHYYCERWERLDNGDSDDIALALRIHPNEGPDGILVVVGDHFNYVFGRRMTGEEKNYPNASTVVDLVDQAIAAGDRITAESYLSMDAGHGSVSKGWLIDCAIQPWKEGTFMKGIQDIVVEGDDIESCCVLWKGSHWGISNCSLSSVSQLRAFFAAKGSVITVE